MPFAIDMFCGAGGFSEGIIQAGFDILFSSDKSEMVQETYMNRHRQLGLIQGKDTYFQLADIRNLSVSDIFEKINSLKYDKFFRSGDVDVIFGGPPCQGFSRLGKRDPNDPRNMLFHEYLRIIKGIKPKYVVMENVVGILDMQMFNFPSISNKVYDGQYTVPYILKSELDSIGYSVVDIKVLNAADYGVPQKRNRAIFLAHRNDVAPLEYPKKIVNNFSVYDAFGGLYEEKEFNYEGVFSRQSAEGRTPSFLTGKPILRTSLTNMEMSKHNKTITERFSLYKAGENKAKVLERVRSEGVHLLPDSKDLFYNTLFQLNAVENASVIKKLVIEFNATLSSKLSFVWLNRTNQILADVFVASVDDRNMFDKKILLLSHKLDIDFTQAVIFWKSIIPNLNTQVTAEELDNRLISGDINKDIADALITKKAIRSRLDSTKSAPTMVTLPDDYIHPYFNRILTVREIARIQSFDDSFEFLGKRTTGGNKRSQETPQFTQVGNAVPPLLARAVAQEVMNALKKATNES